VGRALKVARDAVDGSGVAESDDFEEVLAAAQTGAAWAVAALYERHQHSVLRYLSARVPRDAEDLASQVWLEAARGIGRFEGGETGFRCWLFVIARRRAANERRRLARARTVADGAVLAELPARDDPEVEAISRLAGADAARLLPSLQAEIVLLRLVAGLSVSDTAALVNKKPGTVRVLQHRALRTLAKRLDRRVTEDNPAGIRELR
jgi:RNA polymerase sigma-70 factor (ECF subfamily)